MRAPGRGLRTLPWKRLRTLSVAVLAGTAAAATLAAAGGAETVSDLERQADLLRAKNAALAAQSQSAYSALSTIEGRLGRVRAELVAFRTRADTVRERRRAVARKRAIVRAALQASQGALTERLQTLYEHGEQDTLAVVLGSGSLDAALTAVETLDLAAHQDADLVARARAASVRLAALDRALAERERELEQLAAARAAAAASLVDAHAERRRAIASIRSTQSANAARIEVLNARARTLASVQASAAIPVPGAPAVTPSAATSGVNRLTVVATAYALRGRTASGSQAGWGAVAVDPGVIPLGSRLAIPGYGIGVASDTGGAIKGARIDLWFPSVAEANAWGNRVVTVTVYSN